MWGYLKNRLRSAELKAKTESLIREQMLELLEKNHQSVETESVNDWIPLGQHSKDIRENPHRLREKVRDIVHKNPHAKNYLRLLEVYVTGPGLMLTHTLANERATPKLIEKCDDIWQKFLKANTAHYSFREHARRTWRDGEAFLHLFPQQSGPPAVRFIDPERIEETSRYPGTQGILTDNEDQEEVLAYFVIDLQTRELEEELDADEVLHTKYNVDSNQKRGVSALSPLLELFEKFEQWMETELLARKLQSSIVLWRKVQGTGSQLVNMLEKNSEDARSGLRKEKVRPGTILTTTSGTEMKFLQPDTNFKDAMPLGRMMLLCLSAGAGLPEFMLTADASNANLASTLVAEGPAVKFFEAEQHFFITEFNRLWTWVMEDAISKGDLPRDTLSQIKPKWALPKLVVHNRAQERLADARLVDAEILSRAEVARRDGVEPERMQAEISREKETHQSTGNGGADE